MESVEECFLLVFRFLTNLIVLKTTAVCVKEEIKLLYLSALLGVAFSFLPQIFLLSNFGVLLFELGISVWYVCICFNFSTFKKFFGLYFCYSLFSLFYFGLSVVCKFYFGIKSLFVLNFLIIIFYLSILELMEKFYKRKMVENFVFDAKITSGSKKIECKAFLDSGNLLFDTLTNMPINFISFSVFDKLFDELSFEDVILENEKLKKVTMAHFVRFKTLGGTGKVFVFQVDELSFEQKSSKNVLLGLSLQNMGKKFGADILLNNAFAQI